MFNRKIFSILLAVYLSLMPVGNLSVYAQEEITMQEPVTEVLELSLQDAIRLGLEDNKDIEVQKLELLKAEVVYKDRIRGIEKSEDNLKLIPVRDSLGNVMPDAVVNKAFIKNGGARLATELGLDIAKWNLEMKENELKYNIEKAYFDLLKAESEMKIAEENFKLAQKQYDNGNLRYEVGMISKQQLLGLDFNLSQARSNLETSKMYYEIQKMSFKSILNIELDREIVLTDVVQTRDEVIINTEESIKEALLNNGRLKSAAGNVEVAKLNLQALSGMYPSITYAYRAQAADVAKAEQNLQSLTIGIEMQVRTSILNLQTAKKQIETFEKAVFQASEGVRIAELSFELGQNTATEVAQANLNLMNAKKNLAQQIHAYNLALLDFEYSTGIGK